MAVHCSDDRAHSIGDRVAAAGSILKCRALRGIHGILLASRLLDLGRMVVDNVVVMLDFGVCDRAASLGICSCWSVKVRAKLASWPTHRVGSQDGKEGGHWWSFRQQDTQQP